MTGPPNRGRFIVLEGAEGTGKSTQVRRLSAFLRGYALEVVEAREPGGTEVGERIRELVLHGGDMDVPRETELFLILAARAAFVERVVRPALDRGAWVVSDRFDLSTFAYQGYGRGIDLDAISTANGMATGECRPDLYLVLDLPVEEGRLRQRRQGKSEDRIEASGLDFLERVRGGYVALAESWEPAVLVSALPTADEVEQQIRATVTGRFPETFTTPEV